MATELRIISPFFDEQTRILLEGDAEEPLLNIIISRLCSLDYEVLLEDSDGNFIPVEEYNYGSQT